MAKRYRDAAMFGIRNLDLRSTEYEKQRDTRRRQRGRDD
jgi:hypothetical protein